MHQSFLFGKKKVTQEQWQQNAKNIYAEDKNMRIWATQNNYIDLVITEPLMKTSPC